MKRTAIALALATQSLAAQQPPRFQSSVDLISIDVNVVDGRGRPIQDLAAVDFLVKIDGNPRRVVSAEWVPLMTEAKIAAARALPEGYSSNEAVPGGRLIMLVVDEPNIRFGGNMAVVRAASAFIDKLSPSDRVAAIGLSPTSPATPFIADRKRVKDAIGRMVGQKRGASALSQFNIAMSEALAINNGDRLMTESVWARECRQERTPQAIEQCHQGVLSEALMLASETQQASDQTIRGLREILLGLRQFEGAKTLILMSEGFAVEAASPLVIELGDLAAAARTSLYALQLEDDMFDVTQARRPTAPTDDRRARSEGLETLAGASRGTLFHVAGTAATIFDRIESELSGYYLLGVESEARDRDGRAHPVRVDVPRRGALVRARRQYVDTVAADPRPRSPREIVAAALSAPLLLSALPVRVVTFSLQGPEQSKVQVLIHADVGSDYAAARRVAVGYVITDRQGHAFDTVAVDTRLAPVMVGVPSALQYVAGASLPPGEYMLKLAAADGDRVGTVEHTIRAALVDAGSTQLSELMVGGPVDPNDQLRPTVGYTVSFGSVHAYLEAYGPESGAVKVKYEIATDAAAPALVGVDVAPRPSGDRRALFTQTIPLRSVPAGKYHLRAIVTKGSQTVKTLTRAFEVAPPAVLMTSAEGAPDAPSSDGELFLPIDEERIAAAFNRDEALAPATLDLFRARLAPAANETFNKAIAFITAKDWTRAELTLKSAISPDQDSTPALAYLAVCFAASGHDPEAASAWQTALIDGSDIPQLYHWLGDALLRTRDMTAARSVYEEALGKWPADPRFMRPAAMLYATFGKGREAVRILERYLEAIGESRRDAETLALGVEWLYQVRSAGGVVHSRAEDLKLARAYADQYAKKNGPKAQLVKQWVEYIEQQNR